MKRWTFLEILAISCIPVVIAGALYFIASHWNG